MQDYNTSITNTLELVQSSTEPLEYCSLFTFFHEKWLKMYALTLCSVKCKYPTFKQLGHFFKCDFNSSCHSLRMKCIAMRLLQYNIYFINIAGTDGLCTSIRASVAIGLNAHPCISSCLRAKGLSMNICTVLPPFYNMIPFYDISLFQSS